MFLCLCLGLPLLALCGLQVGMKSHVNTTTQHHNHKPNHCYKHTLHHNTNELSTDGKTISTLLIQAGQLVVAVASLATQCCVPVQKKTQIGRVRSWEMFAHHINCMYVCVYVCVPSLFRYDTCVVCCTHNNIKLKWIWIKSYVVYTSVWHTDQQLTSLQRILKLWCSPSVQTQCKQRGII